MLAQSMATVSWERVYKLLFPYTTGSFPLAQIQIILWLVHSQGPLVLLRFLVLFTKDAISIIWPILKYGISPIRKILQWVSNSLRQKSEVLGAEHWLSALAPHSSMPSLLALPQPLPLHLATVSIFSTYHTKSRDHTLIEVLLGQKHTHCFAPPTCKHSIMSSKVSEPFPHHRCLPFLFLLFLNYELLPNGTLTGCVSLYFCLHILTDNDLPSEEA